MPKDKEELHYILGDLNISETEFKEIGESLKRKPEQKNNTVDLFFETLKSIPFTTREQLNFIEGIAIALFEKYKDNHYGSSLKNKWIDRLNCKSKKHLKYLEKSRPLSEANLELTILDLNVTLFTALRWQGFDPLKVVPLLNLKINSTAGIGSASSLTSHLNALVEHAYGEIHLESIPELTDKKLHKILKFLNVFISFDNGNDILGVLELSKSNPFFMYFIFCFEEKLIESIESPHQRQILLYRALKAGLFRAPKCMQSHFSICKRPPFNLDFSKTLESITKVATFSLGIICLLICQ